MGWSFRFKARAQRTQRIHNEHEERLCALREHFVFQQEFKTATQPNTRPLLFFKKVGKGYAQTGFG